MAALPYVFRTQTTVMSDPQPEAVFDTIISERISSGRVGVPRARRSSELELDAPGGPAISGRWKSV